MDGRPPASRAVPTMRRQAIAGLLKLASATDDLELRYQCYATILSHSGDPRRPVLAEDGVPPEVDADVSG